MTNLNALYAASLCLARQVDFPENKVSLLAVSAGEVEWTCKPFVGVEFCNSGVKICAILDPLLLNDCIWVFGPSYPGLLELPKTFDRAEDALRVAGQVLLTADRINMTDLTECLQKFQHDYVEER